MERAGAWLGSFEPDEAAFEGFIVSCVSGMGRAGEAVRAHQAPQHDLPGWARSARARGASRPMLAATPLSCARSAPT
ncbi:MAG: hypothetical protein ACLU37_08110 [Collinsella sp.]